jgi:hypothetical protein
MRIQTHFLHLQRWDRCNKPVKERSKQSHRYTSTTNILNNEISLPIPVGCYGEQQDLRKQQLRGFVHLDIWPEAPPPPIRIFRYLAGSAAAANFIFQYSVQLYCRARGEFPGKLKWESTQYGEHCELRIAFDFCAERSLNFACDFRFN